MAATESKVRLTVQGNYLCFPCTGFDEETREYWGDEDVAVVYRYPAGDCDVIAWPLEGEEWEKMLRSCLFDARESGVIPPRSQAVELPDGTEFAIEE